MAKINLKEELIIAIVDLPEVVERKSKFNSKTAYFVGKREIAHFHGDSEIDIRLTKPEKKRLKAKLDADARVESSAVDWVAFRFRTQKDVKVAVSLVALAAKANLREIA